MPVPFLSGTPSTGGGASGGGGAGGTWGPPSTPGEPGTAKPSDNPSPGFSQQPGPTPYPLPNPADDPPFAGGQCAGEQYLVSYTYFEKSRFNRAGRTVTPPQSPRTVTGPFGGFSLSTPNQYGHRFLLATTGDGSGIWHQFASNTGISNPQVTGISRVDGEPDDCGDPPAEPTHYTPPDSAPPPNDPQAPGTPGPPGAPGAPGPAGPAGRDGEDGEPSRPIAPGPGGGIPGGGGGVPFGGGGSSGGGSSGGGSSGGGSSGGPSTPGGSIPPTPDDPTPEPEPDPEDCNPCEKIDELVEQLKEALLAEGSGSISLPACEPDSTEGETNEPESDPNP